MGKASRDKIEWRLCVGLPDYLVSEYGDVMRISTSPTRRVGHQPKGGIKGGYRHYKLMKPDGTKGQFWGHRLVCEAFNGTAPTSKHQVAHGDGNPLNNHYTNLRWATVAENAQDKVKHGRSTRGVKNCKAKLDDEKVREIRGAYEGRTNYHWGAGKFAKKFGVRRATITEAATGRKWSHVGA